VQRPFTVLHTIETSGIGGAENVLLHLAASLDRSRFRSIAALPRPGLLQESLEARGVPTRIVRSGPWWDPSLPLSLARICKVERVDLIHAHLPDQNFYGCVAGRVAGTKTVTTFHGALDLWRADTWRGAAKLRLVRSAASAVVAVCDSVRDALVARRFRRDRVTRIYNGIDLQALRSAPRAALRPAFGWPESTPIVGVVANVRVSKGYDHFVRAARHVADVMPTVRFVAAGDIDPALGRPIVDLVRDIGMEEHVKFLGFRADVPAILRDFDVFALPSTSEGFPLALLEAMACGRAIVATRCGGPEELIDDGINGWLVPVGDARALADRILQVLGNRETVERVRRAAFTTANGFALPEMVGKYESLYSRLLS